MTMTTLDSVDSPLAAVLDEFFLTKTSCDVAGTMSYFSRDLATYTDATLGWDVDSFAAVQAVFEQYMPTWGPPARSYSTRTLSNEHSALIHMVDTPELFGGELRILAAVDFVDGKIIRWVDYWDATPFDTDLYAEMRTPGDLFPTDLKDGVVATQAAPEMVAAATALQSAFADGDAEAASALLHTDVVWEDMTLRTRLLGGIETAGYLTRVLDDVPYGRASTLRHVVGGRRGGGFEWTAGDGLVGITAIELGADGLITRVTSVYDGRQLPVERRSALLGAAFAPDNDVERPRVWIGHAGPVGVSDLDGAIEFYANLGLQLIHRNDRIAAMQLRGGTHLVLAQADDPVTPQEPPFDLMVEDLGAYREELDRAGLSASPIETLPVHRRMTVTDPDGSRIPVYDSHVVGPA